MDWFKPTNAAQLKEALAWCAAEGESVAVRGMGSKSGLGRPIAAKRMLDTSALKGAIDYQPEELVLTCAAATPLRDILLLLEQRAQMLAFEPPDLGPLYGAEPGSGTIAGALAANLGGPRRVKMGAARDHFLGFSAVSGRGEAFKAGGKVVKNVTGYDLPKLMAGSMGTLAVFDTVTVKVMPAPAKSRTVLAFGLDPSAAVALLADALNSPWEVSGASYLPANAALRSGVDLVRNGGGSVTAIRVEGTAVSVAARCEALRKALPAQAGQDELHTMRSKILWEEVRDARTLLPANAALWRVSLAATQASSLVAALPEAAYFFDWGGGLVWLAMDDAIVPARAGMLRAAMGEGHATLMRASDLARGRVPVFQPLAPGVAALTRGVKAQFDPRAILNPGRMYEGV
jgi:glycolate oxidase FAD binding subunit